MHVTIMGGVSGSASHWMKRFPEALTRPTRLSQLILACCTSALPSNFTDIMYRILIVSSRLSSKCWSLMKTITTILLTMVKEFCQAFTFPYPVSNLSKYYYRHKMTPRCKQLLSLLKPFIEWQGFSEPFSLYWHLFMSYSLQLSGCVHRIKAYSAVYSSQGGHRLAWGLR